MTLDQIKKQLEPFNPEYYEETDDYDTKTSYVSIDFPDFEYLSLTYDTSPETSNKKNKGEIGYSFVDGEESFYGVYKGTRVDHFVQMMIDYYPER